MKKQNKFRIFSTGEKTINVYINIHSEMRYIIVNSREIHIISAPTEKCGYFKIPGHKYAL